MNFIYLFYKCLIIKKNKMNNFIPLQINDLNDRKDVNLHVSLVGLNENLTLEEIENINRNVFYLKIVSILFISGVSILFGLMPYMWYVNILNVLIISAKNIIRVSNCLDLLMLFQVDYSWELHYFIYYLR